MCRTFIKVLQIIGYAAYFALGAYCIVRIVKLGMPKWIIIIPFIPVALVVIIQTVHSIKIKQAREAYTADVYVQEVLDKKKQYAFETVDGDTAIYAYGYVITDVVNDLWVQKYRYDMDWQERKAIADKAIPVLMKDLESETLCYTKMWADDGTQDGKYYKTAIEYWDYEPNTDTLTIKFSHKDEPDIFENGWVDAK